MDLPSLNKSHKSWNPLNKRIPRLFLLLCYYFATNRNYSISHCFIIRQFFFVALGLLFLMPFFLTQDHMEVKEGQDVSFTNMLLIMRNRSRKLLSKYKRSRQQKCWNCLELIRVDLQNIRQIYYRRCLTLKIWSILLGLNCLTR